MEENSSKAQDKKWN